MSFLPIRRILPKAIQAAGIQQQVTSVRVLAEASSALQRLWGEERSMYAHPVSFHDGVLKIEATAPAALQELRVTELRLQNELNRLLGSKTVHRIVSHGRF
jgi:hypothetical protein